MSNIAFHFNSFQVADSAVHFIWFLQKPRNELKKTTKWIEASVSDIQGWVLPFVFLRPPCHFSKKSKPCDFLLRKEQNLRLFAYPFRITAVTSHFFPKRAKPDCTSSILVPYHVLEFSTTFSPRDDGRPLLFSASLQGIVPCSHFAISYNCWQALWTCDRLYNVCQQGLHVCFPQLFWIPACGRRQSGFLKGLPAPARLHFCATSRTVHLITSVSAVSWSWPPSNRSTSGGILAAISPATPTTVVCFLPLQKHLSTTFSACKRAYNCGPLLTHERPTFAFLWSVRSGSSCQFLWDFFLHHLAAHTMWAQVRDGVRTSWRSIPKRMNDWQASEERSVSVFALCSNVGYRFKIYNMSEDTFVNRLPCNHLIPSCREIFKHMQPLWKNHAEHVLDVGHQ